MFCKIFKLVKFQGGGGHAPSPPMQVTDCKNCTEPQLIEAKCNILSSVVFICFLAKDREAYDNIHSWSIHVHDRGESVQDVEKELLGFKQILKVKKYMFFIFD